MSAYRILTAWVGCCAGNFIYQWRNGHDYHVATERSWFQLAFAVVVILSQWMAKRMGI